MIPRSHFMHQGHLLIQNVNTRGYLCGGCKTDGNGMNFGCQPCNFQMHDFCTNCPTILSSFLHPEHPHLRLMISNTQYPASPRICDVCEDTVEGLFYWCQTCNFNVHPLCTQFPQSLWHAAHYPHRLMFQKPHKDAPCCVCGGVCNSWRYRCGYCDGFDVHADCVAKSYDAKSHETTSRRLPPWAGLYTYSGVSSTANSYNNHNPPCASNQTTQPYHNWSNQHVGVPPSTYNSYGAVPHGTYAYQPINPYEEMTNGLASCTYHQNGFPLDINSVNTSNPFNGLPCNLSPYSMCHPQSGESFCSNSQHLPNHQGNTSHQAPAQNAQTSPAQGHGVGKIGKKVFGIVTSLTLGVLSNVIFGVMF